MLVNNVSYYNDNAKSNVWCYDGGCTLRMSKNVKLFQGLNMDYILRLLNLSNSGHANIMGRGIVSAITNIDENR